MTFIYGIIRLLSYNLCNDSKNLTSYYSFLTVIVQEN